MEYVRFNKILFFDADQEKYEGYGRLDIRSNINKDIIF